jgi:hypothetical protein
MATASASFGLCDSVCKEGRKEEGVRKGFYLLSLLVGKKTFLRN